MELLEEQSTAMLMAREKVFCIGWHKTGTSSLGMALIELGYSVVGARLDLEDDVRNLKYERAIQIAHQFDAVQDVPWAILYKELHREFPDAKFILTDRNDDNWIKSAVGHFGDNEISMHELLYGNGRCKGNESLYLERFRRHRVDVRRWVAENKVNYIELNLESGDGWEPLCEFLAQEIPKTAWPHVNKAKHKRSAAERTSDILRQATPNSVRRLLFNLRLRIRRMCGKSDPRDKFNNFEANRNVTRKSRDRIH